MAASPQALDDLTRAGYVLLRGVYSVHEIGSLASRLAVALQQDQQSVLRSQGQVYGSRDLMQLLPEVCEIPRHPMLKDFIASVLGPQAGLVRALYFDKPPGRCWSLPWHRDRTIAVRSNKRPTRHFRRPTLKAGIPHVEAPESLLAQMLTLRVHLDAMTPENGPLSVIPGSHLVDQEAASPAVELYAEAGDVLAMRPLLSHSSSLPWEGTAKHRRVIHLECAPSAELPDEYEWYAFRSVA